MRLPSPGCDRCGNTWGARVGPPTPPDDAPPKALARATASTMTACRATRSATRGLSAKRQPGIAWQGHHESISPGPACSDRRLLREQDGRDQGARSPGETALAEGAPGFFRATHAAL